MQTYSDFAGLEAAVPGLMVKRAGGAVPVRAAGVLHGIPFIFTYEWGRADLKLGEEQGTAWLYESSCAFGTVQDADLSREQFIDLMMKLVPALERGTALWGFVSSDPSSKEPRLMARARSARHARECLIDIYGFDTAVFDKQYTCVSTETRSWPEVDPEFVADEAYADTKLTQRLQSGQFVRLGPADFPPGAAEESRRKLREMGLLD